MKSRKVRLALAAHPRTPRRIALRLIRELYTFDLMQFSLIPAVAADLKRVADELLVARLASITSGGTHFAGPPLLSPGGCRLAARQGIARLADRAGESAARGSRHRQSAAAPGSDARLRQSRLPSCQMVGAPRGSHGVVAQRIHARWPAPSNSRAASRPRNCATCCTLPACPRGSRVICGRNEVQESRISN